MSPQTRTDKVHRKAPGSPQLLRVGGEDLHARTDGVAIEARDAINYLGTSVVMTAIFYGWGLGLAGTVGHAAQWLFVMLGWILMLGWSQPWLSRFRQGPLEWIWRRLSA